MRAIKINHVIWVAAITVITFLATFLVTPDWLIPYRPVANVFVSAFVGAVGFVAIWRQAVESSANKRSVGINSVTNVQGSNIAGHDIIHVVHNVYQNAPTTQVRADDDLATMFREFNTRIVKVYQNWSLYTRSLIRPDEPPMPSRGDVADSMNALVDYLNNNGYMLETHLRQNISSLLALFRRAWEARELTLSLAPYQAAGHRESGLRAAEYYKDAASIIAHDVPPLIETIKTQLREARGMAKQTVAINAKADISRNTLPSNGGTMVDIQQRNLFVRVTNHNKDYPLNVDALRFVTATAKAVVLQPFNLLYDNLPPMKFTVPPDTNDTFIANGQRLAENLRAAGLEGNVDGVIELEEQNGTKWYSDGLAISTNELGRISQPNVPKSTTEAKLDVPTHDFPSIISVDAAVVEKQARSNKAVNEPNHQELEKERLPQHLNAEHIFARRLGEAFPGLKGIEEFKDEPAVDRLMFLLREPLCRKPEDSLSEHGDCPFWWFRGSRNMYIDRFEQLGSIRVLMEAQELTIGRVVAVRIFDKPEKDFVYVEVTPDEPSGVYSYPQGWLEKTLEDNLQNRYGYFVSEEYGVWKGKYISTAELYDGATIIDGKPVRADGAQSRIRYLSPYNFCLGGNYHVLNCSEYDDGFTKLMDGILLKQATVDNLVRYVETLDIPLQDRMWRAAHRNNDVP